MSYPFHDTPSVRIYSRDKTASIVAAFEVSPPSGFGSAGDVAVVNQHRFMLYFYIPEHETYIALAYLSTLWGNYPAGPGEPPSEVAAVQELLSFNVSMYAARQLTTPPEAFLNVTSLTNDNWPDYVNGETVDNWSPPGGQFCSVSCLGIVDDGLGFSSEDFLP